MKQLVVAICCLTIPLVVQAQAEQNQPKKKKAGQQQQQQQQQQHIRTGGKGKHSGQDASQINAAIGHHHAKNTSLQGQTTHEKKALKKQNAKIDKVNQVNGQHLTKKEIKHFDLANKPNAKIESAKFQNNHHIEGSEHWHGDKYVVFQNYHSQWHDHYWWHQHYDRVLLISGGWYFWNAGFWYPAWGYDSAYSYYPYDGPIYATSHNLPPDQVIANVQSALQDQGFYKGEIDGLLGPLTRAALADYQQAQGLTTTAAIDEPTLDSLGLS